MTSVFQVVTIFSMPQRADHYATVKKLCCIEKIFNSQCITQKLRGAGGGGGNIPTIISSLNGSFSRYNSQIVMEKEGLTLSPTLSRCTYSRVIACLVDGCPEKFALYSIQPLRQEVLRVR
jgi:hypothetical protein